MRKMKKLFYIFLFTTLLLSLTGCKEKQLQDASQSSIDTSIENSITENKKIITEAKGNEGEQTTAEYKASENKQEITTNTNLEVQEKPSIPQEETTKVEPIQEIKSPISTYTVKEQEMISTLSDVENEVDALLQSNEANVQDKLKGIFITIVDFIFYDGEIKGITFKELGDEAKQKVLQTVAAIDTKIENKFPSYKETISAKTKDAFHKMSDMIHKGAKNIQEFSKEKLGEENYNSLINAKNELVFYTKNALHTLGNVASGIWDKSEGIRDKVSDTLKDGKDKVQNWYENLKNGD